LIVKGHILLTRRNLLTGERHVDKWSNVIVNNCRVQESRLIAGDGLATRYISQIGFGTDGTAESASDTALTAPVAVAVGTVSYPSGSSVKFEATLPSGTGNGTTFQEMGLLCVDNSLAARKAFAAMTKSSIWEWSVEWTIQFS
jgi:hypothetical protein